jgi:hypothetical protein
MGTLDYVFVNQQLSTKVLGAKVWHVNEDEPDVLDYNLDYRRNPNYFDGQSPARSSDHSPVLMGLDLSITTAAPSAAPSALKTTKPTVGRIQPSKQPVAAKATKMPVPLKPTKAKAAKVQLFA